jgi:hypothetical protein
MRTRHGIALLGLFAVVVICGCLGFWFRPKAGKLEATVLGYAKEQGVILAKVSLKMPSDKRITPHLVPKLEVLVETSAGWEKQEFRDFSQRPESWHLRPDAQNSFTLALPSETTRWRLVLSLREAGLQDRLFFKISKSGFWASDSNGRTRQSWASVLSFFPNSLGRLFLLQSEIFRVHGLRKNPRDPFLDRPTQGQAGELSV